MYFLQTQGRVEKDFIKLVNHLASTNKVLNFRGDRLLRYDFLGKQKIIEHNFGIVFRR